MTTAARALSPTIGVGAIDAPPGLHSYDHGAGSIIDAWRRSGRLQSTYRTTQRVRLERGRGGAVLAHDQVPVRTAAPVDQLMDILDRNGIVRPVAQMRPLGTLKN